MRLFRPAPGRTDQKGQGHERSGDRRRRLYRRPYGARAYRRRRDRSSFSTISRPASPGPCPKGAKLVVGDTGDADLVARLIEEHAIDAIAHFAAKIVVPESVSDPAGLLSQQCLQRAHADRSGDQGRGEDLHLFLDRGGLRGNRRPSRCRRTPPLAPISPYGRSKLMVEWMLEDASRALRLPLCGAALFQCRRRRSARAASASRRRTPPISSSAPSRPRSDSIRRSRSSARTIRPATAPACATISRSPTSSTRT